MLSVNFKEIEEEKLWQQYSNTKDIYLRNQIVEKYSYLVKIIALKLKGIYQQYGDVEDIINEGIIALISVTEKYDYTKNVKFETYAAIRIKGAIIDYVRKQDWTPRKVKQDAKIIKEAERELVSKIGRLPDDSEIAQFLKIEINEYHQIIKSNYNKSILSFEELMSEANIKEGNTERSYENPEKALESKELYIVLKDCINNLNEKEKIVVSLYYKEELKLKEIADILNISTSRVSQIHTSSLNKLEKSIKDYLTDKK